MVFRSTGADIRRGSDELRASEQSQRIKGVRCSHGFKLRMNREANTDGKGNESTSR